MASTEPNMDVLPLLLQIARIQLDDGHHVI